MTGESPLFIGYYTTEPAGYKEHAVELIKTIERFRFEHDFREVVIEGDWYMRIAYKAQFCANMCAEYPGRKLCLLDVDARLRQYPQWLIDFNGNLSVHVWRHGNVRYGREDWMCGTILFRSSCTMFRFFNDWHLIHTEQLRSRSPKEWENWPEHTLAIAVSEYKHIIDFREMPASYCMVFDRKHADEPVIEHLMANRQHKQKINLAWKEKQTAERDAAC